MTYLSRAFEHVLRELRQEDLDHENENPDEEEHLIFEKSFENIDFVVDLPGTDHVEDLHEHKGCEHDSHVSGWAIVSQLQNVKLVSSISVWSTRIDISVLASWCVSAVFRDEKLPGKNDSEHYY